MNIKDKIVLLVTITLCFVVVGMVGSLIVGLFDPTINNDKIFEIISPAFQTTIGGFIGILTGIHIGQKKEDETDDNQ
jgi:hypothetical protein